MTNVRVYCLNGTLTCLKSAGEVDFEYSYALLAGIGLETGLSPPQSTSLAQLTQMTQSAPLYNTPDLIIMDHSQRNPILFWPAHHLAAACYMQFAQAVYTQIAG